MKEKRVGAGFHEDDLFCFPIGAEMKVDDDGGRGRPGELVMKTFPDPAANQI